MSVPLALRVVSQNSFVLFFFRKSAVSIKFPLVILGPEMAAPILWAPGIFGFLLLENPHAHEIPPFRGAFWVFLLLSRDTLQNGVSHRCTCVKLSTKGGGYRTILGPSLKLAPTSSLHFAGALALCQQNSHLPLRVRALALRRRVSGTWKGKFARNLVSTLARPLQCETNFYPLLLRGRKALSLRGCQNPGQYWIKIVHPWIQTCYPVMGLGSGGRLLRHFRTTALHWMNFSLRCTHLLRGFLGKDTVTALSSSSAQHLIIFVFLQIQWGVAKGSSVSWVAKVKGDRDSEYKLSNGWLRSCKVIKLFFNREMSGREVTGRQISIPFFHGTLLPMDFWTRPRFLIQCLHSMDIF